MNPDIEKQHGNSSMKDMKVALGFAKYQNDFIVKTLLEKVNASTPKAESDDIENQIKERIEHLVNLEEV